MRPLPNQTPKDAPTAVTVRQMAGHDIGVIEIVRPLTITEALAAAGIDDLAGAALSQSNVIFLNSQYGRPNSYSPAVILTKRDRTKVAYLCGKSTTSWGSMSDTRQSGTVIYFARPKPRST
jgi:hypothetical protein